LVLTLVVVIAPGIEKLADRWQEGKGFVEDQEYIKRRRLPRQVDTQRL
jgi:hypothetical protein